MPHFSSNWVQHQISGGWATDYGSTYYAAPQNGVLSIPWCRTCENIKFNIDGSFGKYPGLQTINNYPIKSPAGSLVENSQVRFLYNYTRMGASLTGTSVLVGIIGSYLYSISLTEVNLIGAVYTSTTRVHYPSTFNDLLIIPGSPPVSWDQTTYQNLAGTPPSFGFSTQHNGRQWAAGVSANPSRLYYSVLGNPEDWVGSGSGSIDIDPGDGDAIVALLSWKRELWVFKGPNRLSIHRITGSVTADFARVPFVYGISAAGQGSIFPTGNDFGFWSPRGSCHSLQASDTYGDYAQSYINYPLLSWFQNSNNVEGGEASITWQTITDPAQNITYCVMNNHPAYTPEGDLTFMMDWRFVTQENPYPRFIRLKLGKPISSVALVPRTSFNYTPTFGDTNGNIYMEYLPSGPRYRVGNNDIVTTYPYRIETPALTYGSSTYEKTMAGVSVDIVSNFNGSNELYGELDFSYSGRGTPAQTITFTATTGSRLGSFTLGVDQLGGAHDVSNFAENVEGVSRAFTYTLVEDGALAAGFGTNVIVRNFGVLLTPSGESLEN